jgi:DUF1365 family protein
MPNSSNISKIYQNTALGPKIVPLKIFFIIFFTKVKLSYNVNKITNGFPQIRTTYKFPFQILLSSSINKRHLSLSYTSYLN